ncbi:transposase [Actinopolyspora biskrensis]|uniref:Transposase n=1 Tax=Actinopolyspora biskrensis TaxID=1470178 RepID=A0A852YSA8_9ACTN|nr:transposase [Actinopolyspora biskrensis]
MIEPLPPRHEQRFRHPGRCRIDDRRTQQGILFVLYTGIRWEFLPQELGFESGPTCWRRLEEWQQGWGMGRRAAGIAGQAARGRPVGFLPCHGRCLPCAGQARSNGSKSRSESGRPWSTGLETPRAHRRVSCCAPSVMDRRSLPRCDPIDAVGASAAPGTRLSTADPATAHRPYAPPRLRRPALGRRSRPHLAPRPPQTPNPVGNPRRHAQAFLHLAHCMHDPHSQTPHLSIMKRLLSPRAPA